MPATKFCRTCEVLLNHHTRLSRRDMFCKVCLRTGKATPPTPEALHGAMVLKEALALMESGYRVYSPMEDCGYDLVATKDGRSTPLSIT